MAMNDDDENDDLKVSPSMSVGDFASSHPDFNNSPVPQAPKQDMSLGDVRDMFKSAKDDLLASKTQGISQDDLDALHKHEAANMWTSLFMNFIGAAGGGVDASPYMKPLQTRLEQERQGLALKNQLANQQSQRAGQEQSFGMGQMKANQALSEQQILQSPLTETQKGVLLAMKKLGRLDNSSDVSDIQNQQQYGNILPGLKDVASLQNQQQLYGLRDTELKQDKQGNYIPVSRSKGVNFTNNSSQMSPDQAAQLEIGDDGKILGGQSQQQSQQPSGLKFSDISSGRNDLTMNQQKTALKEVPKIQSDYQKSYGIPDNTFGQVMNNIDQLIDLSQKGNYKAANSLAAQTARLYEGLGSQKLTNQQINMENDPTSSGYYNRLGQLIQGAIGSGKVTPQDAANMKEVSQHLKDVHDNMIQDVKNQYRTKASSVIGKQFNDDPYLFGSQPSIQQSQGNKKSGLGGNVISADDYLKSLEGK